MDPKVFDRLLKFYQTTRSYPCLAYLCTHATAKQKEVILEFEKKELLFHKERDQDLKLESSSSMTEEQMRLIQLVKDWMTKESHDTGNY